MNNIGTLNDQSVNQTKSMEIYFYFRSILFFFCMFYKSEILVYRFLQYHLQIDIFLRHLCESNFFGELFLFYIRDFFWCYLNLIVEYEDLLQFRFDYNFNDKKHLSTALFVVRTRFYISNRILSFYKRTLDRVTTIVSTMYKDRIERRFFEIDN